MFFKTPVPEIENDSARVIFPEISKVALLLIVVPDGFFPRADAFVIATVPALSVVVPL